MTAVDLLLSFYVKGIDTLKAYEMVSEMETDWLYFLVNSKIKSGEIVLSQESLCIGTRIGFKNTFGELIQAHIVGHEKYDNTKVKTTHQAVVEISSIVSILPPLLNPDKTGSDLEYINELFIPFMEKHKLTKNPDKVYNIVYDFITHKGNEKYAQDLEEIVTKINSCVRFLIYMELIPYLYKYIPPLEERIKDINF